jgi:hypothetical protein
MPALIKHLKIWTWKKTSADIFDAFCIKPGGVLRARMVPPRFSD